jgi:phage terminase large subunit-like protein
MSVSIESTLAQRLVARLRGEQDEGLPVVPSVADLELDVVGWMEDRFYIADTKRPIVLEPFQKVVLNAFFERRDDGRFKYHTGFYSTIKKGGKTSIAGAVQQWACETWREFGEVYHMGNKLEQAKGRGLKYTRQSIILSPYAKDWDVTATKLTYLPNNSFIQALPVNAAGEAGGNQCMTTWTELHGYKTEEEMRMYDELQPVNTQPLSFRFEESYAGYKGESILLWDIWQKALEGERIHDELPLYANETAGLIAFIDQGKAARRMPWQQDPEYYAKAEESERPANFKRLHLNLWVESLNKYVEIALWEALEIGKNIPPSSIGHVIVGVDASRSNDTTAVVAVTKIEDTVIVLGCWVIDPQGRQIDYAKELQPILANLFKRYRVTHVKYDQWQLDHFMMEMGKQYKRIKFEPVDQDMEQARADTALEGRIKNATITYYDDMVGKGLLKQHLENANGKEVKDGEAVRIVKRNEEDKIDAAKALAMATYGAQQYLTQARAKVLS